MTGRRDALPVEPAPRARSALVISLDFELAWGVFDSVSIAEYRANLLGVRRVVPRLLELFAARNIHATWATVGFLFFDRKRDLLAAIPDLRPEYADPRHSPYLRLDSIGDDEDEDPLHLALSLVEAIRAAPGQEVGTHTMAHHCCLEPGHTTATFAADLAAARAAAAERGVELASIVFPRNQYSEPFLEVCRHQGLRSFRANEDSWIYRARPAAEQRSAVRLARLLDAYLPVSGENGSLPVDGPGRDLVPVPSSRFLRPFSPGSRAFEALRLRRIVREMTAAARRGHVFHLWWHPHNFGLHEDENFRFLERILDAYATLSAQYGMRSLTMAEVAGGR